MIFLDLTIIYIFSLQEVFVKYYASYGISSYFCFRVRIIKRWVRMVVVVKVV